jgi:hypothetical protein
MKWPAAQQTRQAYEPETDEPKITVVPTLLHCPDSSSHHDLPKRSINSRRQAYKPQVPLLNQSCPAELDCGHPERPLTLRMQAATTVRSLHEHLSSTPTGHAMLGVERYC